MDTPNTVLRKLLLKESIDKNSEKLPISFDGLPVSLAQILEVIYEIESNGYSRQKATRILAARRNTSIATIMDKYCKQLGLKAKDVDLLFEEPGYKKFCDILKQNFKKFKEVIGMYFDTLTIDNFVQLVDKDLDNLDK